MTGQTGDSTKKALDDALSFPILTEEVTLPTNPRETAPAPGRSPLSQIIQGAIGEVLGCLPKPGDPNSFLEALNKSFSLQKVSGHTEYSWTPRGYTAYTEMGAVTGAQASLFVRATSALDDSLPLLEGLKPLRADADPEDSQAARAIVRSNLTELVTELGEVGGPRVQRVDDLFGLLLGIDIAQFISGSTFSIDAEEISGDLGLLRERLGLEQDRVNTIEEEQNFTNFLVLVDYVQSLFQSWIVFRDGFVRTDGEVFFGTQLVLLSRSLGVVAESVQETYFAMNSVFLGPAERETTDLNLSAVTPGEPEAPITVAELLDWVRTVAGEEGPRLIREGGKDGVIALSPTLDTLSRLVSKTFELASDPSHPANPTSAFHTARVQRALEELSAHLEEAFDLAGEITRGRPEIIAVDPESVFLAEGIPVPERLDVDGEGFQNGARVLLKNQTPPDPTAPTELAGASVTVVSPNQVRASFLFALIHAGIWDVVVENPDGGFGSGVTFTVTVPPPESPPPPPPEVTSVEPSSLQQDDTATVTLTGQGFAPGARLDFGDSIGVAVNSINPSAIVAEINISRNAAVGPRDVSVTNPDGQTGTRPQAFQVTSTTVL
ncbi:MAG: IPT/TIG domain-containing protein [Actinomycetota bacterium]